MLPERGSAVSTQGKEVGRVTSVARHFEDGPIALAVIKRNTPDDVDLLVGEIAGAQTVVVAR